jgi:hypothetical protein
VQRSPELAIGQDNTILGNRAQEQLIDGDLPVPRVPPALP